MTSEQENKLSEGRERKPRSNEPTGVRKIHMEIRQKIG